MNNVKFTGENIAAAVLIIFYFLTWMTFQGVEYSGFAVTKFIFSSEVSHTSARFHAIAFCYIVFAFVPLSAAIILNQNITGKMKYSKYFKPAHFIPVVLLILLAIFFYFVIKALYPAPAYGNNGSFYHHQMELLAERNRPGIFDILSFGFYISLIAGIYLFLVGLGRIKDKEYYKLKPSNTKEV